MEKIERMSKFLTTKGISYELENIIKRTKSTLYIVTPYLKLHEQVVERLKYIDKKGKSIIMSPENETASGGAFKV
jgi:CO dehydrogenase/acetyl-CoA synthase epsilon subunit